MKRRTYQAISWNPFTRWLLGNRALRKAVSR